MKYRNNLALREAFCSWVTSKLLCLREKEWLTVFKWRWRAATIDIHSDSTTLDDDTTTDSSTLDAVDDDDDAADIADTDAADTAAADSDSVTDCR